MAAFVKFSRGLKSTYENLRKKDPNTLYLVYENSASETGLLYLGNKLISSVNNVNNINLTDLADVSILNDKLSDGSILYYNNSTGQGQWTVGTILDILPNFSQENNISIVENLNEIFPAHNKDIAVVDSNVYIYNIDKWEQLTDSRLIARIATLENQIGQAGNSEQGIPPSGLYKDIADLQASTDLSNYVQNNDERLLTEDEKKKLDSLGLDDNNQATIQAVQVSNLTDFIQQNQYIKSVQPGNFQVTEYGELQLKSIPSIDLTDYVKNELFQKTVGSLDDIINRIDDNSSLVDEINNIKTSIRWQDLRGNNNA